MNAPTVALPRHKQLIAGWILMALALVVGGGLIVAGVVGFAKSVIRSVENLQPAQDGRLTVDVAKRSTVYIFTSDGTQLTNIQVTGPSGSVPVRSPSTNIEVTSPNATGVAVASFSATEPGRYAIKANGGPFSAGLTEIDTAKLCLAGLGFLFGGIAGITGLVLVITASVARGRVKKARVAASAPYSPWGQQPGYPQQQPTYPQQPAYPQMPANPAPQTPAPPSPPWPQPPQ
jgi:hypothetical protein